MKKLQTGQGDLSVENVSIILSLMILLILMGAGLWALRARRIRLWLFSNLQGCSVSYSRLRTPRLLTRAVGLLSLESYRV